MNNEIALNSLKEIEVETITKRELARLLDTNWKLLHKIIEEKQLSLPESIRYEHHRGNVYDLEDMLQWIKDCNIIEEIENHEKKFDSQKIIRLDNEMAQKFLRNYRKL